MNKLYIFNRQLGLKDVIAIDTLNLEMDVVSVSRNVITSPFASVDVSDGDIAIIRGAQEYICKVVEVVRKDKTLDIVVSSFLEFLNVDCILDNLSGSIFDWVRNLFEINFTNIDDDKAKLPVSVLNGQLQEYTGTYAFEKVGNGKDAILDVFYYKGVFLDYSISIGDDDKVNGIEVIVKNANDYSIKTLKHNVTTLCNIQRTFTQEQNKNKLVLIPEGSGETVVFYLLKNGTISTNSLDEERFDNVNQIIKTYAEGSTAEALIEIAEQELLGQEYNNNIQFDIVNKTPYDLKLFDRINFIDKDGTVYNSFVSKVKEYDSYKTIILGIVRTSLTDKLNKAGSGYSASVSSGGSGGGSSYVLPAATENKLGGIISATKTVENDEVKIDTSSSKLYSSTYTIAESETPEAGFSKTYLLKRNGEVVGDKINIKDDVLEFASLSEFPTIGEVDKIYVTTDTNKIYRWGGSSYTEISASLALGETSSTAYRGDRGATAYNHSQVTNGTNPHNTTFSNIANKPTTLDGYGITDGATKQLIPLWHVPYRTESGNGEPNASRFASMTSPLTNAILIRDGNGRATFNAGVSANQGVTVAQLNSAISQIETLGGTEWTYDGKIRVSNVNLFWYQLDLAKYDYKLVMLYGILMGTDRSLKIGLTTTSGGTISSNAIGMSHCPPWYDGYWNKNRTDGCEIASVRRRSALSGECIINRINGSIAIGSGQDSTVTVTNPTFFSSFMQSYGADSDQYRNLGQHGGTLSYNTTANWLRFKIGVVNSNTTSTSVGTFYINVYRRLKQD